MKMTSKMIETQIAAYNFDYFVDMSADIYNYRVDNNLEPPFDQSDLWEMIVGMDSTAAFKMAYKNNNFSLGDNIFCFDGYGNLVSYSSMLQFVKNEIDYAELAAYINKKNSEFGVDI